MSEDKFEIPPFGISDHTLFIHFIPQYRGDTIIVRIPHDDEKGKGYYNILIDAGRYNEAYFNRYTKLFNIEQFDYVFVSHGHKDHFSGLLYLLDPIRTQWGGKVKEIWLQEKFQGAKTKGVYARFKRMIAKHYNEKIRYYPTNMKEAGDLLKFCKVGEEQISIRFLGPNPSLEASEEFRKSEDKVNDSSIILEIEYLQTKLIFTGDAGSAAWKPILENIPLNSEYKFMKLAHHGSDTGVPNKNGKGRIKISRGYSIATWHPSFNKKDFKPGNSNIPPKNQVLKDLNSIFGLDKAYLSSVNYDIRDYGYGNMPTQYIYALTPQGSGSEFISIKLFAKEKFADLKPEIQEKFDREVIWTINGENHTFHYSLESIGVDNISNENMNDKLVRIQKKDGENTNLVVIRWNEYKLMDQIQN